MSIYNAVRAHFEFMNKLGVDRWCFHDRDIAPDGKTLKVFTISFLMVGVECLSSYTICKNQAMLTSKTW